MSSARLEEMLADAGLAPAEQAELSELLLPLVVTTELVPEPSAELAALFGEPAEGGDLGALVPRAHAVRRWRVRTASVGAVVLAVSSVGATGLSAAANSLPSAVQHHVSQFSQHYLPFDFPEPPEQTDQPLGEGRFALAPESSLPHGDDERSSAAGGVVGIEPPRFLVGADRPSQTGPFFLAPAQESPDPQQVRTSGHQGHPVPSAAPSPAASASPSASPSPSADEAEQADDPEQADEAEQAFRSASRVSVTDPPRQRPRTPAWGAPRATAPSSPPIRDPALTRTRATCPMPATTVPVRRQSRPPRSRASWSPGCRVSETSRTSRSRPDTRASTFGHVPDTPPRLATADAVFVTGHLLVGGDLDTADDEHASAQLRELLEAGVTHVVDARIEWSDEQWVAERAPEVGYLQHGMDDAGQRVPGEWFDVAVDWSVAAIEDGGTVLTHCHMGVNRGPVAGVRRAPRAGLGSHRGAGRHPHAHARSPGWPTPRTPCAGTTSAAG